MSNELRDQLGALAIRFRRGETVATSHEMVAVLEAMIAIDATAAAQAELSAILGAALACQQREDWLGLADYLDFELSDWLAMLG